MPSGPDGPWPGTGSPAVTVGPAGPRPAVSLGRREARRCNAGLASADGRLRLPSLGPGTLALVGALLALAAMKGATRRPGRPRRLRVLLFSGMTLHMALGRAAVGQKDPPGGPDEVADVARSAPARAGSKDRVRSWARLPVFPPVRHRQAAPAQGPERPGGWGILLTISAGRWPTPPSSCSCATPAGVPLSGPAI